MAHDFCENCRKLGNYSGEQVIPEGGTKDDIVHTCPHDGNRWWQFNTRFHIWKHVLDDEEWQAALKQASFHG